MRMKETIETADWDAIESILESGDYPDDATHIGFVSQKGEERVIFYRQNREDGHWSYYSVGEQPSESMWLECLNRPNNKIVRMYIF